jgi:hypothetical protein
MSDTEVVEERGEYRAVIEYDTYPSEPENEMGYPILRIDGTRVDPTGYGSGSAEHDGLRPYSADDALSYFMADVGGNATDAVDLFDRWLRIFHNGRAVGYHLGYSREYGHVAYSTEAMVRHWGVDEVTEDHLTPELDEWEAYCEGDVYLVAVQRLVKVESVVRSLDGEEVIEDRTEEEWLDVEGWVGGYYGQKYAREAAVEMLDGYAPSEKCPTCGQPDNCGDCTHVPPDFEEQERERAEWKAAGRDGVTA